MTAMNLVKITEQAAAGISTLQTETGKKLHEFIYHELSRRNKPMDEYEDTYRIKSDFFCCTHLTTAIYFEREKNGTVIIAKVVSKS